MEPAINVATLERHRLAHDRTLAYTYIYMYIPIYYILTYSVYPEFVPEYLQKRGLGLRIGLRIKGLRIGLRIKKHLSFFCAPKCRLASLPPTGKHTNWSIAELIQTSA